MSLKQAACPTFSSISSGGHGSPGQPQRIMPKDGQPFQDQVLTHESQAGEDWSLRFEGPPGVTQGVTAIAIADQELYVGGDFTQTGYLDAFRIARWNGGSWATCAQE
ncbi:hypothetical protein JXQ70_13850 [bacterium]|nr:hypothetical protein [bacterium]